MRYQQNKKLQCKLNKKASSRKLISLKKMSSINVWAKPSYESSAAPAEVIIISNSKYQNGTESPENELDISRFLLCSEQFNITPVIHREKTTEEIRSLMLEGKFLK